MKKKGVLGLVLAASMVLGVSFTSNAAGNWINTEEGWKYKGDDGEYAYGQYVDGWYIDYDGVQRYEYQASWRQDSTGWWYGDDSGWYANDCTCVIDGNYYYFDESGYWYQLGWKQDDKGWYYEYCYDNYVTNEYIDGCWIDTEGYYTGTPIYKWYQDDKGWYYMDSEGNYLKDQWATIDNAYYTFDDKGYVKEYTFLEANEKSTELKFNLTLEKKDKAARQLQNILIRIIYKGTTAKIKVNGVEKSATNENGIIKIDGKTLSKYFEEESTKKNEIEVSINTTTKDIFTTIFDEDMQTDDYAKLQYNVGFTEDDTHYDYKMTFGGVTLSKFEFHENCTTSFEVDGKKYSAKATIWPGEDAKPVWGLNVEGNHLDENWIKTLVNSGVIDEEVFITN